MRYTASGEPEPESWGQESMSAENVRVSGHVYDVGTGLVTTIVDAKARK